MSRDRISFTRGCFHSSRMTDTFSIFLKLIPSFSLWRGLCSIDLSLCVCVCVWVPCVRKPMGSRRSRRFIDLTKKTFFNILHDASEGSKRSAHIIYPGEWKRSRTKSDTTARFIGLGHNEPGTGAMNNRLTFSPWSIADYWHLTCLVLFFPPTNSRHDSPFHPPATSAMFFSSSWIHRSLWISLPPDAIEVQQSQR